MSDPSKRQLTLRDVSLEAGVSEMTVSRVLRNSGEVSEATREKVLESAKRLGYVPNRIAGALASQRVSLVSVVVPSLSNMVFPEVLAGINAGIEESALQSVIGVSNYLPEREEQVLFEMLSWRPSGVILAGLEHSDAARAMLRGAGVPVVEIMDTDGKPIHHAVGLSHRKAGASMARAILERGYRRIGFAGSQMSLDHRARKRFEGFVAQLAKAGVELCAQRFYSGGSSIEKGRRIAADLLEERPDLDFICFSNDMIAAGGLFHLMAEGYSIPEQIGLAGFNGLEIALQAPIPIATIDACRREIGEQASALVLEALEPGGEVESGRVIELTPQIIPGETMRKL